MKEILITRFLKLIFLAAFFGYCGHGYGATLRSSLDHSTLEFTSKTKNLVSAKDCFPIHIKNTRGVNTLYLFCSKDALDSDGKGVEVSENFAVSDELARRFHFWRRIYSLWSEDQYVLHLAKYPEVTLEIADTSDLDENLHWRKKQKAAYRILKYRKAEYRRALVLMHRHRKNPEKFSPVMKRIEDSMKHIKDHDKYLAAANSIRTQRGQRDPIETGISNSTKYMEILENIFEEEGIPKELAKIAFIESSFNLKAHSKVGASGVYQLMPGTARQFKLKITSSVDERRDPIKSARAAAKLLKENFRILKKWPLAITAYNHGAYGIRRAVRKAHTSEIEELIKKYKSPSFGFASKNFYTGYLAVLATINNAKHIFSNITSLSPLSFTEVRLRKATTLATIRKKYMLTNEVIRELNPDISRRLLRYGKLPRNYLLKIPAINTNTAQASID